MIQFRVLAALTAISLMSGTALAQNNGVSTSVTAGPLHGEARAGPVPNGHTKDSAKDSDDRDRDPNCTERSVTVESPNGSSSSSASVSSSSNGSTVVAGGGSPGSRTTTTACGRTSKDGRPSQASDGKDGDMR
jgi:hypothetical protein